jgi:hypothetical protein
VAGCQTGCLVKIGTMVPDSLLILYRNHVWFDWLPRGTPQHPSGSRLHISSTTVRKHLEHIYDKIGQRDRLLAVAYARRLGLLPIR